MSIHWGGRGPGHTSRWPKAAVSYDPATTALIARMTTPPSGARAALIDACIRSLKVAGVWDKLDFLYFQAAHDAQAALLNWVSSSFDATAVNSPTFTTDRGYAPNGSTSYLNTNWIPSASSLFLQNSGSIGYWLNAGTDTASDTVIPMGAGSTGPADVTFLAPYGASSVIRGRVNQNSSVSFTGLAVATRLGYTALSRTGASATYAYRNASVSPVSAIASSGRANVACYLGGWNSGGTLTNPANNRFAMAFAASGLSDAEQLALYNAASVYLTAVGGN